MTDYAKWLAARQRYNDAAVELRQLRAEIERLTAALEAKDKRIAELTAERSGLKEIEAAAVEAFYLNGYHADSGCMCANCLLETVLSDHSTILDNDRRTVEKMRNSDSGEVWFCDQCHAKSDPDGIVRNHNKTCCHYGSNLAPPALASVSGREGPNNG